MYKIHSGFVKLISYMGSDQFITEAARVTHQSKKEEDRNLIRYLMKNQHTSPFEFCELVFHIKIPIFIARQWVRHRTASVSEKSGRYCQLDTEFYTPKQFKSQSIENKQGTGADIIEHKIQSYDMSATEYQTMLNKGIAREQSRIVLPLSTYTEWYWKIDLHNLLHFLKLRLDNHAQEEFREYAEKIALIVKELFPLTWEAFEDYQLHSLTFSRCEIGLINKYKQKDFEDLCQKNGLSKREMKEFITKLKKIYEP